MSNLSDAERVALAKEIADAVYPAIPGIEPSEGWMRAKHSVQSLVDAKLASVTARLAAAEETLNSIGHFMVGMVKFEKNFAGVFVMERYDFFGMKRQSHSTGAKSVQAAIAAAVSAGWMKPLDEGGGE